MPILTAQAVSRSYARRRVLRDVTFHASAGEIVGLLGPNGAGKSTLLHILSGQMEPSRGAVRYAGGASPAAARAMMGVLGHEPQVYGELSARENMRLFARLAGVADVDAAVTQALHAARVADRADEPVERFSRGMRQRLAFERAVLHQPVVLLLDEPFTGLDDESVTRLLERLHALAAQGASIVLATHDLDLVSGHLDQAYLLHEGRLVSLPGDVPLRDAYRHALQRDAGHVERMQRGPVDTPAPSHASQGSDDVAAIARTALAVLQKDLRIEWRHREGVLTTLFFAVSCVLVFSFGLVQEGRSVPDVGPAVLWVAMAFAGTLAMARSFERERSAGTLAAVLASPASRAGVYLGKWLALVVLLLTVDVVLLPLVSIFFQMPLAERWPQVVPIVLVGTAGYAAVGTLFAAMLSRTRTRDVLLPVLLYPMTVPVMIGGVRGTSAALAEPYVVGQVGMWLALLLCFGSVFVTLSLWTFDALMTDAAPRAARGD
jgi:heme ABC exporter ATP-binding subunit CcmA/heme exporter protein CcmB